MLFRLIECCRGWLMPFPFWMGDLGKRGEYLARRYYHRRGYHCLAKNWRHRRGELDLVMANGSRLVFVEVKARSRAIRIGDALNFGQKQRLIRLAHLYLKRLGPEPIPWSFHLVLVSFRKEKRGSVQVAVLI